jgi:hypothetical protein
LKLKLLYNSINLLADCGGYGIYEKLFVDLRRLFVVNEIPEQNQALLAEFTYFVHHLEYSQRKQINVCG